MKRSLHKMNGKPDIKLKIGFLHWKLDGSLNLGIYTSDRGNWIGKLPLVAYPYQGDSDSEFVSGVKIKTVSLKSNNFFEIFRPVTSQLPFPVGHPMIDPLLGEGFKLFDRCFKGFFFF